jgi:hypothetical protein
MCIASRDIGADEEVTYDYAMSETPGSTHMPFDCRCGAGAACRGRITARDCLLPELRARYAGFFTTLAAAFQAEEDAAAAAGGAAAAAGGAGAAAAAAAAADADADADAGQ